MLADQPSPGQQTACSSSELAGASNALEVAALGRGMRRLPQEAALLTTLNPVPIPPLCVVRQHNR